LTRFALDSNVVIGWLFPERGSNAQAFFVQLLDGDELVASPLLLAECTSMIRREAFDRRVTNTRAVDRLEVLLDLPLRVVDSKVQYRRAIELAEQFQHRKAYDMQHLAVAESERAALVTFDRGLTHAAREIGVPLFYS
jgi:predicted nucleic acid-binding protein